MILLDYKLKINLYQSFFNCIQRLKCFKITQPEDGKITD
ncbi:hypothetical protein MCR_0024 [Moraxella catarrhalis BBH18]|nr:hypothetical protein MCR_0024 [Moraxella catarrhalis BBH18]